MNESDGKNETIFYDFKGNSVAYADDDKNIYLFRDSRPVAYCHENLVYSFSGRQLGRFENGWIWDLNGCGVFFTDDATDVGPEKPKLVKRPLHWKCVRHGFIPRSAIMMSTPHAKVENKTVWSELSGEQFFMR